MYISFSDTSSEGLGGAAQGIIPVQDAHGNMLGGSTSPDFASQVQKEAREVKTEVQRMEEQFAKMMAAVERNTEKVAELTAKRAEQAGDDGTIRALSMTSETAESGSVDMGVLSGHFVRMNDLLSKNSQNVEDLAQKHYDNEQRLQKTMDTLVSKQNNDASQQQERPIQIDFSPLTERLEKVQEAVEQNSALIKALLDESGSDSKVGTPFWGKDQPLSPELMPLTQHMERIHGAIQQQSEHMKALAGYTSGEGQGGDEDGAGHTHTVLSPLGEHLEQIFKAIEEGNRRAKETPKFDPDPLNKHLEALREQSEKNNDHMQQLLEAHEATRDAVVANGGEIDFTPMAEHLEAIRESSDTNAQTIKRLLESQEATRRESSFDFSPLTDHLNAVRTATEKSSEQIRSLVQSQKSSAKSDKSSGLDFTPLTDRLNKIHTVLEKQGERQNQPQGSGDSKFLMNALSSHLSKIQGVTEQNAQHVKSLREKQSSSQDKMSNTVSETSNAVRSLVERTQENESRIDAQNSQMRELMSGQREMVEVMRQLARSVVAQNKGACDHVVVPPPRKMGRKVVGFVYDAKDGTP